MLNLTPVCAPDTDEWLKLRKSGIGASDAPAVCGASEYGTALQVYLRKKDRIPDVDDTQDAIRMGHLLEPVIWQRFNELTNIKVVQSPVGMIRHPEHEFMFATPDAVLEDDVDGVHVGESKATSWRVAHRLGTDPDDVPSEWMVQVQHQLAVTGASVGRMAVLLDGRTLLNYRIERNQALIDAIIDAEKEFWERIKNNDPPEPDYKHSTCLDLIRQVFGDVSDYHVAELSDEDYECWKQAQELKRQIKVLQAEVDRLQNPAKYHMGEAVVAVFGSKKDLMLKRTLIPEAPVAATVRKSYIKTAAVKYDGFLIGKLKQQSKFEAIEALLYGAGYSLKEESPGGSRYYEHADKLPIRVAESDPNDAVRNWLEISGGIDIRTTDTPQQLSEKLSAVL